MNNTHLLKEFEEFDEQSREILMGYKDSFLNFTDLEKQGYGNYADIVTNRVMLGETVRKMNNVSPLAEMKVLGKKADETFNLYYPDAENVQRGNTNVVTDVGVPTPEFDFHTENFYFDNNHNGTFGDTGDTLAFKLLLFVSTDGLKVKECYEVTEPKDDEVILFLETDGGLSKQVLYAKMAEKVRQRFTDENGNLRGNLYDNEIMKGVRKHYSEANQNVIEELMKKGYIEGNVITDGFFKVLKYLSIGSTALPKLIGWILEKLGEGIDFLKIPEEYWDTENKGYFLKKENVIKDLSISTEAITKIKNLLKDKEGLSVTDLMPNAIEEAILYVLQKLENTINAYNSFVTEKIEEIYKALDNPLADYIFGELAEVVAFLAGFWNGAVDFISGIFKFAGALLQAPFDVVTNLDNVLEMVDNFWDAINSKEFWINLWDNMVATFEKIKEELKNLKLDDLNWVKIAYFSGYGLAFIASFFVPLANIANLAKLENFGKLGKIITNFTNEISSGFVKGATILNQKSIHAYQNSMKIFGEILELIKNGGKKLKAFFENIWKKIVEWFKRNKKEISLIDELEAFLLPLIKILKKNPKYLDSLEDILSKGRPLGAWLALESEAAINLYTKSYYILFNRALRKLEGTKMTTEFKAMQKVLDNALEKLPIFKQGNKPLLRSTFFSEKDIRKLFKVGRDFIDQGFFSTTYSESALLRWMKREPNDNVLFKVYGKNGKLIEGASNSSHEAEVLFKSGTNFVVESVKKIRRPGDITREVTEIILKEK